MERDIGTFAINLVGNHLEELTFTNLPGAEPDPVAEEISAPEWQVNLDVTWQYGPLTLNYGYNYFSETYRYDNLIREQDDYVAEGLEQYDARSTHDLQARWDFNERFTLYGGVNNVLDQEPDQYAESYPVSPLGRTFYVGLTASLDSLTQ
jgi:outer membrane receptor protein involved in Fe transport